MIVAVIGRSGATAQTCGDDITKPAVIDGGHPDAAVGGDLDVPVGALIDEDAQHVLVCAVVRHVASIDALGLMTIDILITEAASAVDLLDRGVAALLITIHVPGILVDTAIDHAVGDGCVDGLGGDIANGVGHATAHGLARGAHVGVRASPALLLAVETAILHVEEIGDLAVHAEVYLLHAPQCGIIVEVAPRHVGCGGASRDAGTELVAHDRALDGGAEVFVHLDPVRLHVLYLVGVAEHHLVARCLRPRGGTETDGSIRYVGDDVLPLLEGEVDGRHEHVADDAAVLGEEDGAEHVGARGCREAHPLVACHVKLDDRIVGIRRIGLAEGRLVGDELEAVTPAALGELDVVDGHLHGVP